MSDTVRPYRVRYQYRQEPYASYAVGFVDVRAYDAADALTQAAFECPCCADWIAIGVAPVEQPQPVEGVTYTVKVPMRSDGRPGNA